MYQVYLYPTEPVGKSNHDIEWSKEEDQVEGRVAVGKMLGLHWRNWWGLLVS
jgi:hypothetical protein